MLESSSRPAVRSRLRFALLAAGLLAAVPLPVHAAEPTPLQAAVVEQASGEIKAFYAHRSSPLWVTGEGSLRPAARALLALVQTADYEFPNPQGIYLHDTPDKELLLEDARQFSNGCIRLEDAERLGRWLLGGELPEAGRPETRVDLRQPVPVYIIYLAVQMEGNGLARGLDPYDRDGAARSPLARLH